NQIVAGAARERVMRRAADDDIVAGSTLNEHIPGRARGVENAVPGAADDLLEVIGLEIDGDGSTVVDFGDIEAGSAMHAGPGIDEKDVIPRPAPEGIGSGSTAKPIGSGVTRRDRDRIVLGRAEYASCTGLDDDRSGGVIDQLAMRKRVRVSG